MNTKTDDQLQALAIQYQKARTKEASAKREKEQLGKDIKAALGTFCKIEQPDYKIIWTEVVKNPTDWKAIATVLGADAELIAKYTKRTEEDRLTVDVNVEVFESTTSQ